MATFDFTERFTVEIFNIFANQPLKGIETYSFGFATPTGSEDANINRLLVKDLVYVAGQGIVKKVKRGVAVPADATILITTSIKDINGNVYNNNGDESLSETNGRLFTAVEPAVIAYGGTWLDYPIFDSQAYVHVENGGGADTRELFDFATEGGVGGALEGRIKRVSNVTGRETFIFV